MTTTPTFSASCHARSKRSDSRRAATAGRRHSLLGSAVLVAAVIATGFAHGQAPQAPQALLHQYKCYICHSDTEGRTGPAFIDVAAKYRGNKDALRVLVAAVRSGAHGSGPWHMPPHPEVSSADAVTMVRYILSLKP